MKVLFLTYVAIAPFIRARNRSEAYAKFFGTSVGSGNETAIVAGLLRRQMKYAMHQRAAPLFEP